MHPRPWDSSRGATETVRVLRWVASLAETYARARCDSWTVTVVVRGCRRLEDLARGVSPADLASPSVVDALELVLYVAAAASGPWGDVGLVGVRIAEEHLSRVGLLDLQSAAVEDRIDAEPDAIPGPANVAEPFASELLALAMDEDDNGGPSDIDAREDASGAPVRGAAVTEMDGDG